MRRLSLCSALLLLSSTALAVPLSFTHQGYLADSAGSPLSGSEDLTFAIYDDPAGSSPLWSETVSVTFDGGVYSVVLGDGTPLDADDFSGAPLYLGITVGSGSELPQRSQINSVPYAVRALDATNVRGGVVDASEIQIGGNTVIDSSGAITASVSWDDITNVPTSVTEGSDTLAELSCGSGEVAAYDGSTWACAAANTHAHAASDITSGFLSIDRIPVGGGADQVARGDHSHDFSDLSGKASADQLPTLEQQGLFLAHGGSKAHAGKSCKTILDGVGGKPGDGLYWVDPNNTGRPFQVWCDMTRNDGGWTLVMQNVAGVETSGRPSFQQTVDQVLVRGGTMSENLGAFDLLVGLGYWEALGSEGRYEVGSSVGTPNKQALFGTLAVDADSDYELVIADSVVTIGNDQPGLVTYHNGRPWSTVDDDNDDTPSDNCEANYHHPFWYGSCWSGSIWGSDTGNYSKNAYWTGSGSDFYAWGALWVR